MFVVLGYSMAHAKAKTEVGAKATAEAEAKAKAEAESKTKVEPEAEAKDEAKMKAKAGAKAKAAAEAEVKAKAAAEDYCSEGSDGNSYMGSPEEIFSARADGGFDLAAELIRCWAAPVVLGFDIQDFKELKNSLEVSKF